MHHNWQNNTVIHLNVTNHVGKGRINQICVDSRSLFNTEICQQKQFQGDAALILILAWTIQLQF